MKKIILLQLFLLSTLAFSQVGINTTNPHAQLEIKSSNQLAPSNTDGLLIPKIDAFPAINPTVSQQGMMVYLTTTAGVNVPGFYYWDNTTTTWIPIRGNNGVTLDQAYDFGGAGVGRTITADAGAVTINGTDGLVSTGTVSSGAIAPSGAGTRMVWNPRKAAFRVGEVSGAEWDDINIGNNSAAFGNGTIASGYNSVAFGLGTTANGNMTTAFGQSTIATGDRSTVFGLSTLASGSISTAFGSNTTASGDRSIAFGTSTMASGNNSTAFGTSAVASGVSSTAFGAATNASSNASTAFGSNTNAIGSRATAFGDQNTASSYGETTLGIGATTYTPSVNGTIHFRTSNSTDRLFVIGNAIDSNSNSQLDLAERSDALLILKNGLTRLPSTTNAMITAADGKAVVTKEYLQTNTSGTLDQAYDFGGAGNGKSITADAGAVLINGTDGLVSTGTFNSGAIVPSGAGTRMVWNPRKAAFRAGTIVGTLWDDTNTGIYSAAFGINNTASGNASAAFGFANNASGQGATTFGVESVASGNYSTTFGFINSASGTSSTVFGEFSTASGTNSASFGASNISSGGNSITFGHRNTSKSYAETVLGIGATEYTPSTNGATQFSLANSTDRLFVIGNTIDLNNNGLVETAERSDALIVLKNGLTRLPSSTNAMITAADGKAVVTKEYMLGNTSGTLDQAYDFGGAGLGKNITADAGAVLINGTDGLVSTGTSGSGAIVPSGAGTRMVWNPRKAAFRAGQAAGSDWDDVNVGQNSIAMGYGTIASGNSSIALGSTSSALGMGSVAFGWSANANATQSIAFGLATNANALYSTAFGYQTRTLGRASTSFGVSNEAESFGEVVLGIGATSYTPSGNGRNQFRAANVTDRLFVIGNAIDAGNDDTVDDSERSDAMIILKNGLTRLPSTTNAMITAADGKAVVTKEYLQSTITAWDLTGNSGTNATTNFIGTTDNQAFSVRTDNALRARILATGEFGIGTPTPTQNLEISGPAGTTVTRIANTSATGISSNVALDFFRRTNVNTDWRIFNIGANLTIGNSGDDLATVNDLYQFQGARFMPMNDASQNLGQPTNRWNIVYASNGTINTSDARQKKNIQNLNYGLKDLMKLRPVSFEWNKDDGSGTKLGLIAQELQQVLPEVVRDWDWQEDDKGNRTKVGSSSMGVFYSDIIPVLIKSIQEQQVIINELKSKIEKLENKN